MDGDSTAVIKDDEGHRFVYREEGTEAELRFRLNGTRLVLVHTEVPALFRGRGIGGQLVRAAAEHARTNGQTIVPWCPFARKWLKDHADDVAGIPIDWSEPPA